MNKNIFAALGRTESRSTLMGWKKALSPLVEKLGDVAGQQGLAMRLTGGSIINLGSQIFAGAEVPKHWYEALRGAPVYGFDICNANDGSAVAHLDLTSTPWKMNVNDTRYLDQLHPMLGYLASEGVGCKYE